MARWETDWPTKRAETRAEAKHTSASIGAWMVFTAICMGAGLDETIRAFAFVWQCLHGGH